jgi:alanyl-tRNA synthetase
MVDAERLRFDFSHNAPVTEDELARMEDEVNAVIRQNLPARTELMAPQAAIEAGAVALFGEKYGDEVRVLTLGRSLTDTAKPYSVELCGGTHVARTGDIALFKIVSETGIAAGVRRIEALTGEAARQFLLAQAGVAKSLAQTFKVQTADVPARVEALTADRRALEKQVAELKKQLALGGGGAAANAAPEEINGVKLIARVLDGVDGKGLRGVAEEFRTQVGSGVVALIGVTEGKAAVTVAVTSDMTGRVNAADLARVAVIAMGGQGAGGKPDFAQGGAPDDSKAAEGVAAVKALLAAGANVNAVTTTGAVTALHFAASNGDPATVTALLDKGAPVDTREGAWGQTPLMWAASANRVAALDVLIKHQTHHRGQLTIGMRQAGLVTPGMYGPAKEEWTAMGVPAPE